MKNFGKLLFCLKKSINSIQDMKMVEIMKKKQSSLHFMAIGRDFERTRDAMAFHYLLIYQMFYFYFNNFSILHILSTFFFYLSN